MDNWSPVLLLVSTIIVAMSSSTGPSLDLKHIVAPALALELPLTADGDVTVRIVPRDARAAFEPGCPKLAPNARATLNGVGLTRLTGRHASDDMAYERDCILEFTGPARAVRKPGSDGALLRVEDDSATWKLDVPDAFTPRTMTLGAPGSGVLHRGKKVTVTWSPASDHIGGEVGFELRGAEMAPGTGRTIRGVTVRGARLSFALPNDLPAPPGGRALLVFLGTAFVTPAHSRCPVDTCSVGLKFSVAPLAVTLED